jgi:hypothetical protein
MECKDNNPKILPARACARFFFILPPSDQAAAKSRKIEPLAGAEHNCCAPQRLSLLLLCDVCVLRSNAGCRQATATANQGKQPRPFFPCISQVGGPCNQSTLLMRWARGLLLLLSLSWQKKKARRVRSRFFQEAFIGTWDIKRTTTKEPSPAPRRGQKKSKDGPHGVALASVLISFDIYSIHFSVASILGVGFELSHSPPRSPNSNLLCVSFNLAAAAGPARPWSAAP